MYCIEDEIIHVGKYYTYLKKNQVVCDDLQYILLKRLSSADIKE